MQNRYLIVIENAGSNYSAYSPDLPGCVTTGESQEAVRRNMAEAIEFHLEGMTADGLPIPEPSARGEYLEVGTPD